MTRYIKFGAGVATTVLLFTARATDPDPNASLDDKAHWIDDRQLWHWEWQIRPTRRGERFNNEESTFFERRDALQAASYGSGNVSDPSSGLRGYVWDPSSWLVDSAGTVSAQVCVDKKDWNFDGVLDTPSRWVGITREWVYMEYCKADCVWWGFSRCEDECGQQVPASAAADTLALRERMDPKSLLPPSCKAGWMPNLRTRQPACVPDPIAKWMSSECEASRAKVELRLHRNFRRCEAELGSTINDNLDREECYGGRHVHLHEDDDPDSVYGKWLQHTVRNNEHCITAQLLRDWLEINRDRRWDPRGGLENTFSMGFAGDLGYREE